MVLKIWFIDLVDSMIKIIVINERMIRVILDVSKSIIELNIKVFFDIRNVHKIIAEDK